MSDLIDRQAAIDAIERITNRFGYIEGGDPVTELENLPSAEPISQIKWERDTAISQLKELGYGFGEKPKKGKWIDYTEDGYVECPFCHSATNCDGNKDELHFCFSCGAEMRGEEDE